MNKKTSVYERLGVRRVINARSYATRMGGSLMLPEVVEAMAEAAKSFVRIEELQLAAGERLAEITGAEAGWVTSGAAAGLTLGAAACIAGMDPDIMDRLPGTEGIANECLVMDGHGTAYDHAMRTAGAKIAQAGATLETLKASVTKRTALVFYLAESRTDAPTLREVAQTAHECALPVLVDASAELPPVTNLKRFIDDGADLVAFSGGKGLRGPQCSGMLVGRKTLILSAALQHQDMDVKDSTWPWRHLLEDGSLTRPPRHGIGRPMKVGKEEIVGLVVALEAYLERDHEADLLKWHDTARTIAKRLSELSGISATYVFPTGSGRPVPAVNIVVDQDVSTKNAVEIVHQLQDGEPSIALYEGHADQGRLMIYPECLLEGDADIIVSRFGESLSM